MKRYGALILLLMSVATAMALLSASFPGWEQLTQDSPDIVIARCLQSPSPVYGPYEIYYPLEVNSKIEIICALKTATNEIALEGSVLRSMYWPRQGEYYLIFSAYQDGSYQAVEEYRVVPLGTRFSTNSIIGRPLDEQLQILFKRSVDHLNQEIKKDQEAKLRIETGIVHKGGTH